MADDSNRIEIEIVLDDGSVRKGFANIQKSGEASADGIKAAFGPLAIALAAVTSGVLILKGLKDFMGNAISQAAEAEVSLNRLNSSLRLAGTYSEGASKQFQDMANEIQRTTTIDDDAALSLAALARNMSRSNEEAMKLTQAAIELGVATGRGPDAALQSLNATLDGSAGRLGKLVQDLPNFTAEQLKAGAAIDFVQQRFRGAAAAETNTYTGAVKQLSNVYGNLIETIGGVVTSSKSITTTIKAITEVIAAAQESLANSVEGKDMFKELIINFSIVAQAGVETARRIGLSFALAYERSIQAWQAFKVLTTAGFSSTFNQQLMETGERIDALKAKFGQDSGITQFFGTLIDKLSESSQKMKEFTNGGGSGGSLAEAQDKMASIFDTLTPLSGEIESLGNSFLMFGESFTMTAEIIANDSRKLVAEAGGAAFKSLSAGVASGMSAIGRALVKGEDIFQAFAGAMLGALGQAAIQMGATYILMGIARAFSSYGLDPTATGLIATGSAMSVLGGALMAVGEGVSGGSAGMGSFSAGGGGTGGNYDVRPEEEVREEKKAAITVNIQGDVLDSRETGLRIIEIINEAQFASGSRILAT